MTFQDPLTIMLCCVVSCLQHGHMLRVLSLLDHICNNSF